MQDSAFDAAPLIDEAIERALALPEVAEVLETLRTLATHEPLEPAEAVAKREPATIEAAAADELRRLREVTAEYDRALEDATASMLESDTKVRVEAERLRREVQRLDQAADRHMDAPPKVLKPIERQLEDTSASLAALRAGARERVLADLTRWPELAEVDERRRVAREDVLRALVERGVLQVLRPWLNTELQRREASEHRRDLSQARSEGLGQLPDPDVEIETGAEDRLARLLNHLPSGSVGVSGVRGAGKSTIMGAFCRGDRPIGGRLPVVYTVVQAPVRFQPLDFVMHLTEEVCRSALPEGTRVEPLDNERAEFARLHRLARTARALAIVAGLAVLGLGAILVARGIAAGELGSEQERLVLGGVLIAAGLAIGYRAPPWALTAGGAAYAVGVIVVLVRDSPVDALLLLVGAATAASLIGSAYMPLARRLAEPRWSAASFWGPLQGTVLVATGLAAVVSAEATPNAGSQLVTGGILVLAAGAGCFLVLRALGRSRHDIVSKSEEDLVDELARLEQEEREWLERHKHRATPEDRSRLRLIQHNRRDREGQREELRSDRRRSQWVLGRVASDAVAAVAITSSIGVALLGIVLVVLGWGNRTLEPSAVIGIVLVIVGGSVAAHAHRAWAPARQRLDELHHEQALGATTSEDETGRERRSRVQRAARTTLRKLRYLQTHSSSWGSKVAIPGALKLPFSAEATLGGGRSAAERPLSLPDVVRLFRDFLEEVTRGDESIVVIGIDELDKIASEEDAERFLNEVKAVFQTKGCYFLISISEDAIASFERRGIPFRDVFDTAFDDVLRVDHFGLKQSVDLLGRKTTGMWDPFLGVSHALSGGLPRDLVRIARQLFALRDAARDEAVRAAAAADLADDARDKAVRRATSVAALCDAVVRQELRSKRDGTVTAVRQLGQEVDTAAALTWLASRKRVEIRPGSRGDPPPPVPPPADFPESRAAALKLERLLREFAVFRCFAATLVDFFTDDRSDEEYAEAGQPGEDQPEKGIEHLALARQAFAHEPELAWERLAEFRRAWALDAPEGPSRLDGFLYRRGAGAPQAVSTSQLHLPIRAGAARDYYA